MTAESHNRTAAFNSRSTSAHVKGVDRKPHGKRARMFHERLGTVLSKSPEEVDALKMFAKQQGDHCKMFNDPALLWSCLERNRREVYVKRIIFAWTIGIDPKELIHLLDINDNVVKYLYKLCTHYVKQQISKDVEHWRLGGGGRIVIIDIYPEGCEKFNYQQVSDESILCMAEVKEIPTKYWFEKLNRSTDNFRHSQDQIVETIERMVRVGSTIVVDKNSMSLSSGMINRLKQCFPVVVTVDTLSQHNSSEQNLLNNLEVIWRPALDICEFGCFCSDNESYYASYLWNQRYGNNGFDVLCEFYKF